MILPIRIISGIITFTDKIADDVMTNKLKEELRMLTKVEKLFIKELREEAGEASREKDGKEGKQEERQNGIQILIVNCKKLKASYDKILQGLWESYGLADEAAEECLTKY